MDDFSGLIRPHIDEMRLDEDDEDSQEQTEEEDIVVEKAEDTLSTDSSDKVEDVKVSSRPVDDSNSSSSTDSSRGIASLDDYKVPHTSYERDFPSQYLVALIGREFDEPFVKFVPYTIRRTTLIKGNFDSQDLIKHDVVCMCYNASEARILLTGNDGFYTQLLKQVEALLGPNKVAFIITHYTPPGVESTTNPLSLISPELKTRLSVQNSLHYYLQQDHILSWFDKPYDCHVTKLLELAKSERNPTSYFNCVVL